MAYIKVWFCSSCKAQNRWENNCCNGCGKKWGGKENEPAHWICTNCQTVNLWVNDYCSKCRSYYRA